MAAEEASASAGKWRGVVHAGRGIEAAASDAVTQAVSAKATVVGPIDVRDKDEAAVPVRPALCSGLTLAKAVGDDCASLIDATLHLLGTAPREERKSCRRNKWSGNGEGAAHAPQCNRERTWSTANSFH